MKLKTLVIYALGPIGAALIGLITLPMLAWLYTPDVVGSYSLLNIGISLISLILAFGFDQAYVREYYNFDNHAKLLKHCLVPGFAFLTMLLFVLIVLYLTDFMQFSEGKYSLLVLCYAFIGYFVLTNLFVSYYFRMQQNALMYSLCQFLPKLGFMLLIVTFYLSGAVSGFLSVATAQFAAIACLSCIMLFHTRKVWLAILVEKLEWSVFHKLFTFGFPLMLSNLIFWALVSMDRLALSYWTDMTAVGIFSVASSLALAAGILQVVFSAIWSPVVYRWEKEGIENHIEQFDALFSAVATVIFAAFCLVGLSAWLIDYVLPAQYHAVKFILVCCFAYPLFFTLSEITVVGLHLTRKTFHVLLASGLALITNLIINLLLTPKFGISGAAIATAISFYLLFVFRTEMSALLWRSFARIKTYATGAVILTLACVQALSHEDYLYWALIWLCMLVLVMIFGRQHFKFFLVQFQRR